MSAASAEGGQSWAVHEHGSLKRGQALNRQEDKVRLGGGRSGSEAGTQTSRPRREGSMCPAVQGRKGQIPGALTAQQKRTEPVL